MNENERDTKFLGFAKLLFQDIYERHGSYTIISEDLNEQETNDIEKIIAQRAYDLAVHVLGHQLAIDHYRWPALAAQEAIQNGDIPDLTQWPKNPLQES